MTLMCGATGELREPNDDINRIVSKVKDQLKSKYSSENINDIKVINYRTQVVAGVNYFVKVDLGNNRIAHLRIHEPLPYTQKEPELNGVQLGKNLHDSLEYFEEQ